MTENGNFHSNKQNQNSVSNIGSALYCVNTEAVPGISVWHKLLRAVWDRAVRTLSTVGKEILLLMCVSPLQGSREDGAVEPDSLFPWLYSPLARCKRIGLKENKLW